MKILGIDPDSQISSRLDRWHFAAGERLRVLPARRMGEALAQLECDRDIAACLVDARVAAQDDYAFLSLLSRRFPTLPALIVCEPLTAETARHWLARGARGVIWKDLPADEIQRALRAVFAGGFFLPPGASGANLLPPAFDSAPAPGPLLTPRQIEVLSLLTQGHDTQTICAQLGLTEGTVKNHLGAIYRQLRVRNRLQAVLAARRYTFVLPRATPRENI